MRQRAGILFPSAIAISAAAHLLVVLLVPYRPETPRQTAARVLIPVSLIEAPPAARPSAAPKIERRPAPQQSAIESQQPAAQEPPRVEDAPTAEVLPIQDVEQQPATEEPGALLLQPEAASAPIDASAPAAGPTAQPTASTQPNAEIAAYAAILSALRGRIVQEIRYPALARANGWKGTVVVAVRIDAAGVLLQAIIRQSSGYEVLDRAAIALVRKVTPVSNPLALPVSIEIPIVYELR
jgi:periplasmic protein TonB